MLVAGNGWLYSRAQPDEIGTVPVFMYFWFDNFGYVIRARNYETMGRFLMLWPDISRITLDVVWSMSVTQSVRSWRIARYLEDDA